MQESITFSLIIQGQITKLVILNFKIREIPFLPLVRVLELHRICHCIAYSLNPKT